jgi:hypothetical protein
MHTLRMSNRTGWLLAVGLGLLLAEVGCALAATSGTALIQVDASEERERSASTTEIKLSAVHGFVEADEPDTYHLVLSDGSLDASGLAKAPDREDYLKEQLKTKGRAVWLEAHPDGSVNVFTYYVDGQNDYFSGTAGEIYGLKREGNRLRGHYLLFTSFFGRHFAVDANIDAELLVPAQGKPMAAADLAAASAEYLKRVNLMKSGDLDAIAASMPAEQRAQFEAERGKPEFAAMLAFMQAMQPKTVKVTGGTDYGDWAQLATTGTDSDDSPFKGTVDVRREGGKWVVGNESTTHGSSASSEPEEPKTWDPPEADAIPGLAAAGFKGSEIEVDGAPFEPVDALAVYVPAVIGDTRYIVWVSDTKLVPDKISVFWTEDANNADAFVGGEGRAIALMLDLDEDNELDAQSPRWAKSDNTGDEFCCVTTNAIKVGDRITGVTYQDTFGDDGQSRRKGGLRYDLPIVTIK